MPTPYLDLDHLLGKRQRKQPASPSAKFDAAQTTEDSRLHWANADGLSAAAANSPEVRRVLRNRARYEDANNPSAAGMVRSLADELVGTGPRLQLTLPGADPDFGVPLPEDVVRAVEDRWRGWAKAAGVTDLVHTAVRTEVRDGEAFALLFVNPALADPVQLALRLYEGDQVATPDLSPAAADAVDGIEFDRHGNPAWYHVLKQHPGDVSLVWQSASDYDRVPARQVVHLFEQARPGQARGVPELTASLPTFAVLRRWTMACLLSAEAQARISAVIEQENALAGEDDDAAGEQVQYSGVHLLTLTAGQTAKVLPHSSPPPGYREFKGENLTDGGRPLGAPRNVSTGSSAEYNYSSGRLDQQQWQRAIRRRRNRLERLLLDRLVREWAAMALLVPGYLPPGTPPAAEWKWCWRWDGFVSIDPVKDAKAATERLANGTSSLERECGELGEDWEEVQDQRLREEAREARRRDALGLPPKADPASPPRPATAPARTDTDDANDEGDDDA